MDLRDKKILITGASSGIGQAIARALAGRGALIAIVGRHAERLTPLADEIVAAGHPRPVVLTADLSKPGNAESLAARAIAELGTVDVLINDAAVEGIGSYATAGDGSDSRALFETNYWSPMVLIRALLPEMRARGAGAVVNVSSLGAITPVAGTGHYPSSKAALAIATEAVRAELRHSGIRVVLVYPGFVDTPMLRAFMERENLPARMRRSLGLMPVGQPDALARRVVTALERGRKTVVYPRSYAMTPLIPALSRWFTSLLFGSGEAAAVSDTGPRRCCRWTPLRLAAGAGRAAPR